MLTVVNNFKSVSPDPLHVFIITRFGIGQTNDMFYQSNFQLLNSIFIPGLLNQTDSCFSLVLLLDSRIPEKWLSAIKSILPSSLNIYLWFHDPFLSYKMNVDYDKLLSQLGFSFGNRVNILRVDADDQISSNLVHSIRSILLSRVDHYKKIHVNPCIGYYFYLASKKYLKIHKRNYSVQFLSDIYDESFLHLYNLSHKSVDLALTKFSNSLSLSLDQSASWIRTIHSNSDTSSNLRLLLQSSIVLIVIINKFKLLFRLTAEVKSPLISTSIINKLFDINSFDSLFRYTPPLPPIPTHFNGQQFPSSSRLYTKQYLLDYLSQYSSCNPPDRHFSSIQELFYSF